MRDIVEKVRTFKKIMRGIATVTRLLQKSWERNCRCVNAGEKSLEEDRQCDKGDEKKMEQNLMKKTEVKKKFAFVFFVTKRKTPFK